MIRLTPSRSAPFAVLLASSSLIAACASVPDLGAPAAAKPAAAYAAAKSLDAPVAAWPRDAWWTAYGDAQLTGLIDEALMGSPTMAAAQARVRKADALSEQAGAALKPSLSATGSIAATGIVTGSEFGSMIPNKVSGIGYGMLSGSFDFDLWGRNRAALAAATSEAEAVRADAAQARLTLSTAVAAAYADLASLYASLDAANDALKVRSQTVDLMGQRFANGLENRGAGRQAEAGQAQALGDIAALQESVGLTQNRMAALLGAGPDRGLGIGRPSAAPSHAFGLPSQLQADLLGRRPDVVAARLRAEAAVSRTKQAKAGFYPNVNLSLLAGGASPNLSAFPASLLGFANVGPAISLPIFDGGKLEAQYRGARADHDAAVADYDRTVTGALHDVADVAVSERALTARLTHARDALKAAQAAHTIALDRYTGGLSPYLDVLRTEDLLISSRRAVADLETRAFTLDVALVRALGGGFTDKV
jgi:NodT family efflux transporter outer membrane factor (OMF) lipoprotein